MVPPTRLENYLASPSWVFPGGSAGQGSVVVTVDPVFAGVWVQPLFLELPHTRDVAKRQQQKAKPRLAVIEKGGYDLKEKRKMQLKLCPK